MIYARYAVQPKLQHFVIELSNTDKAKRGFTNANHPFHIQNSMLKHRAEFKVLIIRVLDKDNPYMAAVAAAFAAFAAGCSVEVGHE